MGSTYDSENGELRILKKFLKLTSLHNMPNQSYLRNKCLLGEETPGPSVLLELSVTSSCRKVLKRSPRCNSQKILSTLIVSAAFEISLQLSQTLTHTTLVKYNMSSLIQQDGRLYHFNFEIIMKLNHSFPF